MASVISIQQIIYYIFISEGYGTSKEKKPEDWSESEVFIVPVKSPKEL